FITLEGGSITIGGPGSLAILASSHSFVEPAQLSSSATSWGDTAWQEKKLHLYDEQFVLKDKLSNEPLIHTSYRIVLDNGQIVHGVTDELGRTERIGSGAKPVSLDLMPDEA
ncbi:MAG: hypothetical protein P8015_21020, partial [Acidihalobacter sp.]